jgi:hypothetical protein
MKANIQCRKCRETITLDFEGVPFEQAVDLLGRLDTFPRECPGLHVELSGWSYYWRFGEMLTQVYPDRVADIPDAWFRPDPHPLAESRQPEQVAA